MTTKRKIVSGSSYQTPPFSNAEQFPNKRPGASSNVDRHYNSLAEQGHTLAQLIDQFENGLYSHNPSAFGPNIGTIGLQQLLEGTKEYAECFLENQLANFNDPILHVATHKIQHAKVLQYTITYIEGTGVVRTGERGLADVNTTKSETRELKLVKYAKAVETNTTGKDFRNGAYYVRNLNNHLKVIQNQMNYNLVKMAYAAARTGVTIAEALGRCGNLVSRLGPEARAERAERLNVGHFRYAFQRHVDPLAMIVAFLKSDQIYSETGGGTHTLILPAGLSEYQQLSMGKGITTIASEQGRDQFLSNAQEFDIRKLGSVQIAEHTPIEVLGNYATSSLVAEPSLLTSIIRESMVYVLKGPPRASPDVMPYRFTNMATGRYNEFYLQRSASGTSLSEGERQSRITKHRENMDKIKEELQIDKEIETKKVFKPTNITALKKYFKVKSATGVAYTTNELYDQWIAKSLTYESAEKEDEWKQPTPGAAALYTEIKGLIEIAQPDIETLIATAKTAMDNAEKTHDIFNDFSGPVRFVDFNFKSMAAAASPQLHHPLHPDYMHLEAEEGFTYVRTIAIDAEDAILIKNGTSSTNQMSPLTIATNYAKVLDDESVFQKQKLMQLEEFQGAYIDNSMNVIVIPAVKANGIIDRDPLSNGGINKRVSTADHIVNGFIPINDKKEMELFTTEITTTFFDKDNETYPYDITEFRHEIETYRGKNNKKCRHQPARFYIGHVQTRDIYGMSMGDWTDFTVNKGGLGNLDDPREIERLQFSFKYTPTPNAAQYT
jgi:hypothetical protein